MRAHHAALPYKAIPACMERLRAMEGVVARALELTILTASRTIRRQARQTDKRTRHVVATGRCVGETAQGDGGMGQVLRAAPAAHKSVRPRTKLKTANAAGVVA